MKLHRSKTFYSVLSLVLVFALLVNVAMVLAATPSGDLTETKETEDEEWDLNNIVLDKYVTDNKDGTYKLTLESYIKGDAEAQLVMHPADVVVLLDQSSSMTRSKIDDPDNPGQQITSQVALKRSVVKFVDSMAKNYTANESDHRMAVATFDAKGYQKVGWTALSSTGASSLKNTINNLPNTGLDSGTFIDDGMKIVQNLLTPSEDGGAYSYGGTSTLKREKIVVVFSDGSPGVDVFNMTVANNALKTAKALKDENVTVFTVGMFETANSDELYPTSAVYGKYDFASYASTGAVNETWSEDRNTKTCSSDTGTASRAVEMPASNRFFNLLSSNYAHDDMLLTRTNSDNNGTSTRDLSNQKNNGYDTFKITAVPGPRSASGDYYLAAEDASKLDNLFEMISQWIASSLTNIELHKDSKIRDIVSNYFTLPDYIKSEDDIDFFISYCTGLDDKNAYTWSDPVEASKTQEGKDISAQILNLKDEDKDRRDIWITGFDFTRNCVSAAKTEGGEVIAVGCKLIIQFDIEPVEGFYGGNNVPTNAAGSGVYTADGNSVKDFPPPHVNIEIPEDQVKLEFKANPIICKGNKIQIDAIYDTGIKPDESGKFDFVTRTVEILDEEGKTVGWADDKGYFSFDTTQNFGENEIRVTFAPKDEYGDEGIGEPAKPVVSKNKDSFSVFVLQPTVNVALNDVTRYYGDTTGYTFGTDAGGAVTVTWADEDGHAIDKDGKLTGVQEDESFEGSVPFTADDIELKYTSSDFTEGNAVAKKDFSVKATAFFKNDAMEKILAEVYGAKNWETEFNKLLVGSETQVRVEKWSTIAYTTTCASGCADKTDGTYKVHVKTADLTIKNVGGKENETFVFTVNKDGKFYTKVTVKGGGKDGVTAKISELPIGTYTVIADSNWSWRYTSEFKDKKDSTTLSSSKLSDSVTCINTEKGKAWQGAVAKKVSNVYKKGAKS